MLFNSLKFLVFFPVVTLLYFVLPHRWRWLLLLAASCAFYMAYIPLYILALAFTIVVDYAAGILMEDAPKYKRRFYLVCSLIANIGLLGIFKYYNFVLSSVERALQAVHWQLPLKPLAMLLPIGLSFHTFQAMSYTIEVYRGRQKAERNFGIYALYVMFYPQLVAGPIERPQNILHQFYEQHEFDFDRMARGLQRMLWGFFQKLVVADNLSVFVDQVYNSPRHYHGLPLIVATVLFAFEIYCDFSGYSDIALGAAEVMGFRLMENFRRPYFAKSIAEFWSRWHISLSTWFRDYLYIPLGGSRVPKWRRCGNLLVVFLVSGLWHGANMTYIVWGGLNGVYLILEIVTANSRAALGRRLGLCRVPALIPVAQVGGTFFLICMAWVFFRASSMSDALYIWTHMFRMRGNFASLHTLRQALFLGRPLSDVVFAVLALTMLLGAHLLQRKVGLRTRLAQSPAWFRLTVYYVVILATFFSIRAEARTFIYFQF